MNVLKPHTVQKIGVLLAGGHSLRSVARALKIKRTTVTRYALTLQPEKCVCGLPARHKGWCGPRFLKTVVEDSALAQVNADFVEPPKPIKRPAPKIRTEYPYCGRDASDGYKLLMAVNSAVPKRASEDSRADICQDLILAVLEGAASMNNLSDGSASAIRKYNQLYPPRFGPVSLHESLTNDPNGPTLMDRI
ncbi:MAG: hypothetical protein JWP25_8249 [Bradyrhizobium sp.]|nr:hypothetical protein [Bradyrhizobium sp.]